jgi:large-conductance mechanosensitive channel
MSIVLPIIIAACAIFLVVRLIILKRTEETTEKPDVNPTREIKIPEGRVNNLGRNPKDPRGRR